MKRAGFFILLLVFSACNQQLKVSNIETPRDKPVFTTFLVNNFAQLPFSCIEREFPNKLGQVLNDTSELKSPRKLHPIFYGCFDWHSSVHAHWLLVSLLKNHENLALNDEIIKLLDNQFKIEKIASEMEFFKSKNNESFERTYGWAWILKLEEELLNWNSAYGIAWAKTLEPLSNMIVIKLKQFLPKLVYPIRSGEHTNTAFALSFAYDYALETENESLQKIIKKHAKRFYMKDQKYNFSYEPSGYDFLSPGFQEIDLMRKVLSKTEFLLWLKSFAPEILLPNFNIEVAEVIDRKDGKLVHLDGLNLSRAWCLYDLGKMDAQLLHLLPIADKHLNKALKSMFDGNYMGEHWLASFANYAFTKVY
jgi:hypothetical protein